MKEENNIDLLYNKNVFIILKYFFNNPKDITFKDIYDYVKLSRVTLLKSLEYLVASGLLVRLKKGNSYFYSITESSVYYLIKKSYYVLTLNKLLKNIKDCEIYLFGSYAKGTSDKYSDLDILIIGRHHGLLLDIEKALKPLDIKLNLVFKNPLEYASLAKKDSVFYKEVENSKVKII